MAKNIRKLWVVSEIYYPEKTSTGYYLTEIAEFLAKKKLNVGVITTSTNYGGSENYNVEKSECRNGVDIHRIITPNINKNQLGKRVIRLLYVSFVMFFQLLKKVKKQDEILIVTNPAFLILMMPLVRKIKKIKYSILVHDVFPENIVAINKMKPKGFKYRWTKKVFDYSYDHASCCISIGRDMNQILKEKISDESKIIFIPNWSETNVLSPIKKASTYLCQKLELQNKFVIQFAGNFGNAQGITNLLEAIDQVELPDIHFLFIGGGARFNEIDEFSKRHLNVTLLGYQDRDSQNDFLNCCDLAIVTLEKGMKGLGVPSKSYNIMATGKPILLIAEEKSEIALCINEYNLGWIVEPDNPELLACCIKNIYNQRENFKEISLNARDIAEKKFSKNIVLEQYYQLYEK